ncbi:MAG: hypothetical protein EAZ97_10805 [Bacteroidetes bacterium]|nr:MAG: hypothetical protein EAZ97_10805 [Bacteroidota bacterium]
MLDYYKILQVRTNASPQEIKSAFKKLAVTYHPDKNGGSVEFEEKFKLINEAYQILGDSSNRFFYDQRLAGYQANKTYHQTQKSPIYQTKNNYTSNKKTRKTEAEPIEKIKRDYEKVHILVTIGVLCFFLLGITFFYVMNFYASEQNYREAKLLYDLKDYQRAFEKNQIALNQDSKNVPALYLNGLITLHYYEQYEYSLTFFNQAIELSPNPSIEYYFNRAIAYQNLHRPANALLDLQKILTAVPSHKQALFRMAEIELKQVDDLENALRYYEKILETDPKDAEAWLGKGMVYFKQRNYDLSWNSLKNSQELEPANAMLYLFFAKNQLENQKDTLSASQNLYKAADMGVKEAAQLLKDLRKD